MRLARRLARAVCVLMVLVVHVAVLVVHEVVPVLVLMPLG